MFILLRAFFVASEERLQKSAQPFFSQHDKIQDKYRFKSQSSSLKGNAGHSLF